MLIDYSVKPKVSKTKSLTSFFGVPTKNLLRALDV
jgi:hypothetical protein